MYAEKKLDKVDPNETRLSKWKNCIFSDEPLREPFVIDKLGNILNKEAVVKALLGKKLMSILRENDGAKYQCLIAGLEFNGKYRKDKEDEEGR
ncbi:hypothetical protein RYX36_028506 [Vicia faba]